jgi:hypothetical protein
MYNKFIRLRREGLIMKKKLHRLIQEYGLMHKEKDIMDALYECVRCIPVHSSSGDIGRSKFGGYPHLPVGMEVPNYQG